jgi:hypothetical protein
MKKREDITYSFMFKKEEAWCCATIVIFELVLAKFNLNLIEQFGSLPIYFRVLN